MKLDTLNKAPTEPKQAARPGSKSPPAKYEGNRFSSLFLLLLTVLISLVFYASGQ